MRHQEERGKSNSNILKTPVLNTEEEKPKSYVKVVLSSIHEYLRRSIHECFTL